ncbi:MAG: sortase [bacterium]|nr:sortase [Patescibacteria group bacterium]
MNKEVVIFQNSNSKQSGSFLIAPRKKGWVYLGRGLIAASFLSLIIFFLPPLLVEGKYRFHHLKNIIFQKKEESLSETIQRSKFKYVLSPDENLFELVIPKIGVHTQVKINVDAADEGKYNQVLGSQAAHARGSSLPGENGFVYIFGHSTNSVLNLDYYNPVFYLLKKLEKGDELAIIHQGKIYIYQVEEEKIISPNNLEIISDYENQEKLILQTCWPPGTTWQRLLIIASPIT